VLVVKAPLGRPARQALPAWLLAVASAVDAPVSRVASPESVRPPARSGRHSHLAPLALSTGVWCCYPLGGTRSAGLGAVLGIGRGLAWCDALECVEHAALRGHGDGGRHHERVSRECWDRPVRMSTGSSES
jgi:hypothetical protein